MIKKIVKKIKGIIYKAACSNNAPSKLALSFAIGLYISFSPVPGGHTIVMLAAKWLFKLNLPVLLLGSTLNNPWTIVPFFAADYVFGYWFLHSVIGWNPTWIISLAKVFGSGSVCFWSFFIGGNILGILAAIISYPIMLGLFRKINAKISQQAVRSQT